MRPILRFAFLLTILANVAFAQQKAARRASGGYPPEIEGAAVETYKQIDGTELKVWIFNPTGSPGPRPAIVFFFGGGWASGSPSQFVPQAKHFAERGMVAITADYRVASRQHAKPAQCVADAKSCIRWVRKNAERLGIDPQRIVAAGGSAGGHLAAATATVPALEEPGEDTTVSCVPNALILFNPGLVMAPYEGLKLEGFGSNGNEERFGCTPEAISPIHHVKSGTPPTLIMHGRADTTVPYRTVEAFAAAMKKAGNRCELIGYDGERHGFFNSARYQETLNAADEFLQSIGYLAEPK